MVINDIFVGGDTGLLKGHNLHEPLGTTYTDISKLNREREICSMLWNDDNIIYADKSGTISHLNPLTSKIEKDFRVDTSHFLTGMQKCSGDSIIVSESHRLHIYTLTGLRKDGFSLKGRCDVLKKVGDSAVAYGGMESQLRVIDIENQKHIFSAKRPSNDWLNLPVLVNITGLDIFEDSSLVLVATQSGDVSGFDIRHSGQSPQINFHLNKGLSALNILGNQNSVAFGDITGDFVVVDIRKPKNLLKYRGGRGSIRAIGHIGEHIVAASLDRFVRVWSASGRSAPMKEFYAKSRLTALLLRSEWTA